MIQFEFRRRNARTAIAMSTTMTARMISSTIPGIASPLSPRSRPLDWPARRQNLNRRSPIECTGIAGSLSGIGIPVGTPQVWQDEFLTAVR